MHLTRHIATAPSLCARGLCLLAVTLAPAVAMAAPAPQGGGEPAAAETKNVDPAEAFDVARRLWESGDFATALPLFERALETTGSPNARLYVARCLRDLGRLPEAHQAMTRTVQDAMALAEKEARYAQTRDTAAAELALLDRRVAKVVVALGEPLAGASVAVNGVTLDASRVGQPIAVVPGGVDVVATKPDGAKVGRRIEVAAGTVTTVALTPGAAPTTTSEPAPPVTTSPGADEGADEGSGFGALQGVGIGVALLGVAGFVTFGVEHTQAKGEFETLEQECGPGPCTDPAYADVVDRGKTAQTVSVVGLVVGIAGVLAGAAMIAFGGEGDGTAETAWMPTANGVRVSF